MNERKRIVEGLTEDLEIAGACASLAFHLREMIRVRSSMVRLADDFIWLSLRAARDSSVIHLWKVFDNQKHARSLAWFIRNHSVLDPNERSIDLRRLSAQHNDDVRRLRDLRHELFAHRSKESVKAGDRSLLLENNLSEIEFSNLTRDASAILQRHHGDYLFSQVHSSARKAISQLLDLDVFLIDAIPGRFGIEIPVASVDGDLDAGRQR